MNLRQSLGRLNKILKKLRISIIFRSMKEGFHRISKIIKIKTKVRILTMIINKRFIIKFMKYVKKKVNLNKITDANTENTSKN